MLQSFTNDHSRISFFLQNPGQKKNDVSVTQELVPQSNVMINSNKLCSIHCKAKDNPRILLNELLGYFFSDQTMMESYGMGLRTPGNGDKESGSSQSAEPLDPDTIKACMGEFMN